MSSLLLLAVARRPIAAPEVGAEIPRLRGFSTQWRKVDDERATVVDGGDAP
jgi:hypothetical protein